MNALWIDFRVQGIILSWTHHLFQDPKLPMLSQAYQILSLNCYFKRKIVLSEKLNGKFCVNLPECGTTPETRISNAATIFMYRCHVKFSFEGLGGEGCWLKITTVRHLPTTWMPVPKKSTVVQYVSAAVF